MGHIIRYEDIVDKKTAEDAILDVPSKTPFYLQFVTGKVTRVITEKNSIGGGTDGDTNCILAVAQIGNESVPVFGTNAKRYKPLLRGIVDTPNKDDQVLLCDFGNTSYYLGPLNTENNPNKNADKSQTKNINWGDDKQVSKRNWEGKSSNYIEKGIARLQKVSNIELDDPDGIGVRVKNRNKKSPHNEMLSDIHGDMILEGRHGNSIRIGSRSKNPYMIISNGREEGMINESTLDGSTIALFRKGTIRQHFFMDKKREAEGKEAENYEFKLADGEIENPLKTLEETFKKGYGRGFPEKGGEDDTDINKTVYGYEDDQIFMTSDRVTINAKQDSIFFSSKEHVHVGAGNSITFSTSRSYVINAAQNFLLQTNRVKVDASSITMTATKRINLGDPQHKDGPDSMHPLVDGDTLYILLTDFMNSVQNVCQKTVAGIAARESLTEVSKIMTEASQEIEELKPRLVNMLCPHVWVENGRGRGDDVGDKWRKDYEESHKNLDLGKLV